MQALHRHVRCMIYVKGRARSVIVGEDGTAGRAETSQALAAALTVSIWDLSCLDQPAVTIFQGIKQVICLFCLQGLSYFDGCLGELRLSVLCMVMCAVLASVSVKCACLLGSSSLQLMHIQPSQTCVMANSDCCVITTGLPSSSVLLMQQPCS